MSNRWCNIRKRGNWSQAEDLTITPRGFDLTEIEGNREGLLALRAAIDQAMSGPPYEATCRQFDIIGGEERILVKARDLTPATEKDRAPRIEGFLATLLEGDKIL